MCSNIIKDRMKIIFISKYGVENPYQSEQVKDKIKQTCLEKYGVENAAQSEVIKDKMKKTCLEKYGCEYALQSGIVKDKIKQTCLKRYGVEHPMKLDFYKSKVNAAIYESKKKNHTFNTSKPEENGYKLLYNKFGFCNVKRQYRTELYPFACDFYIKSLDLYIEFNFYWTHGKHKFDSNNKDDVDKLNDLKIKYNNGEHPLYKGAIITWAKSDPKKFNTAKKNNLNYLAFYTWNEFLEWYKLI